ncbi:hypothetical protein ABBZ21_19750 [Acinetobacter baumannii]|uniref:hypothetical protein n=1 Tax=Acinetobacter baumannii TaxID=470 RepID=UPI00385818D8
MEKFKFMDEIDQVFRELDIQIRGHLHKEISFDNILEKIKNEKNLKTIEVLNSFREQTFVYSDLTELQYGYGDLVGFLDSSKGNFLITSDEFIELSRIGECCYLAATARINHENNLKKP